MYHLPDILEEHQKIDKVGWSSGKRGCIDNRVIFLFSLPRQLCAKCLEKAAQSNETNCGIPSALFAWALQYRLNFDFAAILQRYLQSMHNCSHISVYQPGTSRNPKLQPCLYTYEYKSKRQFFLSPLVCTNFHWFATEIKEKKEKKQIQKIDLSLSLKLGNTRLEKFIAHLTFFAVTADEVRDTSTSCNSQLSRRLCGILRRI